MRILIPAGGRGTRLHPLTFDTPKPLLALGEQPILTRLVEGLPPGARAVVLITPNLEPQFRAWRESLAPDACVDLQVERIRDYGPRGPLVAIADCLEDLDIADDVVVMMGDSVHPFGIADFVPVQPDHLRLAAYPLPPDEDPSRFGVVELDDEGRLVSFEEKPEHPRTRWVFTGCLFIPARLLQVVGEIARANPPQVGYLVSGFIERGETVEVFRVAGEWHDIGTLASYLAAHASLLGEDRRRTLIERGNRLEGTVYVHPDATVTGSRLSNCIISAAAHIADADLSDCVIHSGVLIEGRVITGRFISDRSDFSLTAERA